MDNKNEVENEVGKEEVRIAYYEFDYTRKGFIASKNNLPEVHFVYKPLNMIQAANLTDEVIKGKTIHATALANIKMLGKHLVSWDLSKPNGELVDFKNAAEVSRIDPQILNKITGIIRGDNLEQVDKEVLEDVIKNLL